MYLQILQKRNVEDQLKQKHKMNLPVNKLDAWNAIIDSVDQEMIPIDMVKKVVFKLQDGKQRTVNLSTLRRQGLDIEDIEVVVGKQIGTIYEKEVVRLDFVVDVDAVARR